MIEILATPEEWDLIGGAIHILGFITRINSKHDGENKAHEKLKIMFINAQNKLIQSMLSHSHIKEESIWYPSLKKKAIAKISKKRK